MKKTIVILLLSCAIAFPIVGVSYSGWSSGGTGSGSGTATSITDNLIVNADVNEAAAIDGSKLADNTIGDAKVQDNAIAQRHVKFPTTAGYMLIWSPVANSVRYNLFNTASGTVIGRLEFDDTGDVYIKSVRASDDTFLGSLEFDPVSFATFLTGAAGSYFRITEFDNVTIVPQVYLTAPLGVASGGTGSGTASGARTNLGLGSGDNVTFGTVTASEYISSAADNTRGVTVPNTADPTGSDLAAGKCWYNTTSDALMCRNGDNTVTYRIGSVTNTFSFSIDNVIAATDNVLLTRIPRAWTITRADCYASTDNVVGVLMECASDNVTSCTVLDSWTVTNSVNPFTDSSMTDGAVAAGAWLRWSTTSVGTTNSNKLSCTIQYRE